MKWIQIRDNQRKLHAINLDNVIDIEYHEETNNTEITFLRSAITPVWITGNILPEIRKILLSDIYRIGE